MHVYMQVYTTLTSFILFRTRKPFCSSPFSYDFIPLLSIATAAVPPAAWPAALFAAPARPGPSAAVQLWKRPAGSPLPPEGAGALPCTFAFPQESCAWPAYWPGSPSGSMGKYGCVFGGKFIYFKVCFCDTSLSQMNSWMQQQICFHIILMNSDCLHFSFRFQT